MEVFPKIHKSGENYQQKLLMKMKKTIQILGSIFIALIILLSSCTKDHSEGEKSSLLYAFENMEYEDVNEINIDVPSGTAIVMMDDLNIKIGEIGNKGELLLYKTKFIENYKDEDNEYEISFIGLSKDLKLGDIHYAVYDYSNINDEDDGFTVVTMIDLRFPDGTLNNDNHDCDIMDVNELRSGGYSVTHECSSGDSFWGVCHRCIIEYHACGEFKDCYCSSTGLCRHTVTHTRNYNLGGNNMYGLSWMYASGW